MTLEAIFNDMDKDISKFYQTRYTKPKTERNTTTMESSRKIVQDTAERYAKSINEAAENGTLYEEIFGTDEYSRDIYNQKFIIDSYGELEDVRIMIAFGGPNVWIYTDTEEVKVFWGLEASAPISTEAADEIRDLFSAFIPEVKRW